MTRDDEVELERILLEEEYRIPTHARLFEFTGSNSGLEKEIKGEHSSFGMHEYFGGSKGSETLKKW